MVETFLKYLDILDFLFYWRDRHWDNGWECWARKGGLSTDNPNDTIRIGQGFYLFIGVLPNAIIYSFFHWAIVIPGEESSNFLPEDYMFGHQGSKGPELGKQLELGTCGLRVWF